MAKLQINNYMADAARRRNICLFTALKIINLLSHLSFLRECKRRFLIPKGFQVKNKLIDTYPCQESDELCKRQSRQWISLCISQIYCKLRSFQSGACFPLSREDNFLVERLEIQLFYLKRNKMKTLVQIDQKNVSPLFEETDGYT